MEKLLNEISDDDLIESPFTTTFDLKSSMTLDPFDFLVLYLKLFETILEFSEPFEIYDADTFLPILTS